MRTPGRERTSTRVRVALIAFGIVLGTLGGEALARLVGFEFRPHMRNRVYFAEPHPLLGWHNRPGLAGTYGGDEFTTFVTINSDGQRGPSHPAARVPGKRRIAVLGDSQTWGDGVADDETFVARLDGGDTEMLSFATPGWGTDQQILVLDAEAARWSPDVVVLALFIGNDLNDNTSRGTFQYPKPWFTVGADDTLELHGVPVPYSRTLHVAIEVYRALMRHSALLNAIAELSRRDWTPSSGGGDANGSYVNPLFAARLSEENRARFALTARLLREFVVRTRAIGAEPVVLILPDVGQVEAFADPARRAALRRAGADFQRPQRVFSALLAEQGVQVIDALPALGRATRTRLAGGGPHTFYPEWRHLTALGHAVIADLLAARLVVKRRPGRAASDGAASAGLRPPSPAPTDRSAAHSPS
jgi:lysophospholipase L1-like esterase